MPALRPELHRRTLTDTDRYTRVLQVRRASKIILISLATNSGTFRVADRDVADEATSYLPLEVGDAFVTETTKPGDELDWDLFVRPGSSGDILTIVLWR